MCAKKEEIKDYRSHVRRCYEYAENSTLIELPEEDNADMMFKSHKNKLKRPYLEYADTVFIFSEMGFVDKTQKHVPKSACFCFVCDYDPSQNRLGFDIGPNCIVNMQFDLTKLSDECITNMMQNQEMKMSSDDTLNFKKIISCSICSRLVQGWGDEM